MSFSLDSLSSFFDGNFDLFLESFARFCLKFGHITFILPAVVFCMIFFKRDIFAKATCFLLWVMIFNTLLKHLFKVPLFPHLGTGYAFPSGHMHASAAFYGYILYRTGSNFLKCTLGVLLGCIAFSLIECHFHDFKDVGGALLFAILEIGVYHLLARYFGEQSVAVIALGSAIAIMVVLSVIYKVEFHVWLAFYGLAGMELAQSIMEDSELHSVTQKFCALGIALALIVAVCYFFKFMAFDKFCLSEMRFALIPFIIVGTKKWVAKVVAKR